ncbi:MAG: 3-oxoadipate enol-lactonase [Pseudolabrys sp.]|nr:3-oxoadipate enol-lactonase [Pseudolabrys sp.]
MPLIETNGTQINVEIAGPENAPALMLSNSLGTNLHMWDPQADELAKHFRLIRYDRRGHGKSAVPKGPYSMEMLGRDVLGILDALKVRKTNWCGLSMGGMVGQWLAANAPDRIAKTILSNTHSYYADKNFWNDRIKTIEEKGLPSLVDINMQRWFTEGFRQREPKLMAKMTDDFLATKLDGYIGCCCAIRDMDFRASNPTIKGPVMVIVGTQDPATPPVAGEQIAKAIAGAKLASINASHISNVEQPKAYLDTMLGFLKA